MGLKIIHGLLVIQRCWLQLEIKLSGLFLWFSLLYLLINNLRLVQENIGIIENVKLFTEVNKQIFDKIVSMFRSKNDLTIIDLEIDEKLIDKINKFAPIKYILRNKSDDPHHVLELLEDIIRDLNNLDFLFIYFDYIFSPFI